MKKLYKKINDKIASHREITAQPRSSGFYDVQEAEKKYDVKSASNGIFNDGSKDDSKFESARLSLNDSFTDECDYEDDDERVYADIDLTVKEDVTILSETSEYDVPRISFKFFEKNVGNGHVNTNTFDKLNGHVEENLRQSTPIPGNLYIELIL